jgi:glycosyltransferase involved in cell wall biosynthesis
VSTLRIGIDGRAFTSPAAGVRRYVAGLVPALREIGGTLEIVALGGVPDAIPSGMSRLDEPWHPPTNLGWSAVGLPRAAALAGVHLIHAPAYTAPLWSPVPTVLTIHDVSYERHPEWYPYRRDGLRRLFYRRSARGAAHVLTDSEFSAREIAAAYQIPRDRITVAPLGTSPKFAPSGPVADIELPPRVVPPFLLHVGDLHERRNLAVVVTALIEALRRPGMPLVSLVLAGVDRGLGESLRALAASARARDCIVSLGTVSDDQLLTLYRHAVALVYPSRYEGFGLPVLEAMACGTPVIASRAASIPEVLGDAGILLDPDDDAGWAEAMAKIVTDEVVRGRMRAAGLSRAREFTWTRTASITLDVYRRVAQVSR